VRLPPHADGGFSARVKTNQARLAGRRMLGVQWQCVPAR
jgi:hypothetical protein